MIERINDFVARHGGGAGKTAGSFVRIAAWAVFFLVGLSLVLPNHPPKIGDRGLDPSVQNVALGESDQRAFGFSPFGKDRYRIAWITGSEGAVVPRSVQGSVAQVFRPRYFLPSAVVKNLPEVDGKKVAVEVYYLPGMTLADTYAALLDAVDSKPDMIVVSLNPVWVLNPYVAHQWAQLDFKAAQQQLTKLADWPVAASLLSPSDLLYGLGAAFRPIRDRTHYSNLIDRYVSTFGPLNRSDLSAATTAQDLDTYQQLLALQLRDFWFLHKLNLPGATVNGTLPTSKLPLAAQAKAEADLVDVSNEGRSALNDLLLQAIARTLRAANVPSYTYVAPVESAYSTASPAFASALAGVERQLDRLRPDFKAPNVQYQPEVASNFVGPLEFRRPTQDPIHLSDAGPLGPYLAKQLCQLAVGAGSHAPCP